MSQTLPELVNKYVRLLETSSVESVVGLFGEEALNEAANSFTTINLTEELFLQAIDTEFMGEFRNYFKPIWSSLEKDSIDACSVREVLKVVEEVTDSIPSTILIEVKDHKIFDFILKLTEQRIQENEKQNQLIQVATIALLRKLADVSQTNKFKISQLLSLPTMLIDYLKSNEVEDAFVDIIIDLLKIASIETSHLLSIYKLLDHSNKPNLKHIELVSALIEREQSSHFRLNHSSLNFSTASKYVPTSYTLQTSLRFNNVSGESILILNDKLHLKVEDSRLVIYYKQNLLHTYQTQLDDLSFYHIVLIHDNTNSNRTRAKLRLFINSEFIQQIRCPFPIENTSQVTDIEEAYQVKITAGSDKSDISVSNLMFFTESISYEWILLSYFLGKSYTGNFTDDDMFKYLNYNERAQFNLKLLDFSNNRQGEYDMKDLKLIPNKGTLILNFNTSSPHSDSDISVQNFIVSSSGMKITGRPLFYEFRDLIETFYASSSTQHIFRLIDNSKDFHETYLYVTLFFKLVNRSWVFGQEAESKDFYNILATLLKRKKIEFKKSLNLNFLDKILDFIGYNFESPFNSIIVNHIAYDTLILDFQLWKPLDETRSDDDLELAKFLIFQITVFGKECMYVTFNSMKLKRLKAVKKILNGLSQQVFSESLHELVHVSLSTLVKSNLSSEVIRLLSFFVIHALNEKNEAIGILVLKVLAEVFLDPLVSNSAYWKKLYGPVSIKWVLLLLQLGKDNRLVIITALSFMIKIFTISSNSYEVFLKSNGLQILLASLRDTKISSIEINILIKGSFGLYPYDLNISRLQNSIDIKPFDNLLFPELQYIILDTLEWTVLNDIFKADSHEQIIEILGTYTEFLSSGVQENAPFIRSLTSDTEFMKRLCNLILLLNRSQNGAIYFEVSEKIIQILSDLITFKLFNDDSSVLESYLHSIVSKSDDKTDSISTIFLLFVFPKLLIHFKEFSLEFENLLATNGAKFLNLAILLNALNHELLTFEWNSKDYLNYLSVTLEIIEAYKSSSRSLRNAHYLQLVKNVTNVVNTLVFVMKDSSSPEQIQNFLKVLLFYQEHLFKKEYFTNDGVSNLVSLLLEIGLSSDSLLMNLSYNCLRIMLMHRNDDLPAICSCITFRSYLSVMKFLSSILSVGDDDISNELLSDPKLRAIFNAHIDALGSKLSKKTLLNCKSSELKLAEITELFDEFIKKKYEKNEKISIALKNENETLRLKISSSETVRMHRHLQDQHDNIQYYLFEYNKLKAEHSRIITIQYEEEVTDLTWTLDPMEGIDRMRKRLLPLDELVIDDTAHMDVPLKQNCSSENEETSKIDLQSLNSFEVVEGNVIDASLNTYNDRNRKVLKSLFTGDRIVEIWNVSQVIGLEITEGILILGQTHLYLIQNYFHKAEDDEIIEIEDAPENERDPSIKLITGQARPKSSQKVSSSNHSVQSWDIYKLTSVTKRHFLLSDIALELFFSNGNSFLITALKTKERDTIFSKLSSVATNSNIDTDLSNIFKETNINSNSVGISGKTFTNRLATVFGAEYLNYLDATKKWQNGEMSNFYYLMIVNTFAGRTFNDLTQYPIFPWVIADYTSEVLDLTNPDTFRDLSKPMGAQTPQRAKQFQERYEALQSLQDESAPPFHYGTHYSSAMIVASFLIRLEPFVQSYLLLQGGKFDHADRLFYSISKAWNSSSKENTTDVRELIPEFYFLPEFLTNINGYEFGKLQGGKEISDVELPAWAKNDPKIFIKKNREALESPYVSRNLHKWIDLIFGYKQLGTEAIEAINVFNHLSYHGAIDLNSINNQDERRAITGIIHNFGQTPTQIFNKPHPEREVFNVLQADFDKIKKAPMLIYQTKFKSPILHLQYKSHGSDSDDAFWRGYPNLYFNGEIELRPGSNPGSLIINRKTFERLHDSRITTLSNFNNEIFFTGSESGVIHIWRYVVRVKGFDEELQFEGSLRAHSHSIKELKISPEFNLLLSLGTDGQCYLWDLTRYKFLRKIGVDVDHIAIDYDSGMISTAQSRSVVIYTINGEKILDETFSNAASITSLSFANQRTFSTVKLSNNESHEYWKYFAILNTGWSNGDIKLHDLTTRTNGSWEINTVKSLKFDDGKKNTFESDNVTVVESYLKSYYNYEEERTGKIEVVAGDYNGRVAVWRL